MEHDMQMDSSLTLSACVENHSDSEETIDVTSAIMTVEDKNMPNPSKVEEGTTERAICVIDATPISVKLPGSEGITPRKRHRRSKPQPEYIKNWFIVERRRINGRLDKFYCHKKLCFMCRSLVEVRNYELYGLRPSRARKPKENKVKEGLPALCSESSTSKETNQYYIEQAPMNEETNLENFENVDSNKSPKIVPGVAPKEKMEACQTTKPDAIGFDERNLIDVPIFYDYELEM